MQKLAEAKSLKQKAQNFISEGNYEFASRCYEKIIILLNQAMAVSKSQQTISQINHKIHNFQELAREAHRKQKQKEEYNVKISSKLVFPLEAKQEGKKQEFKKEQVIPQVKPQTKMDIQHPQEKKQVNGNNKQGKKPPLKQQPPKTKKNTAPINPIDSKKPIKKPIIKKQPMIPQKKPITYPNKISNPIDKKKPGIRPQKNEKHPIDPVVSELIVKNIDVSFKDVVGLEDSKSILEEAVIRPRKRPDLYTGIRAPPRALLLYGPPGNGKTYICKALAKQSGCTFIALSASSILNKFVGQSQKTIKKIFVQAEKLAPAIIFIDEIDSMLTARTEKENDASRRLKTEFLVLMDGINSPKSGQILVIGATNLPKQLDNAAKRRFNKFIYIGNPEPIARKEMLLRNMQGVQYDLTQRDIDKIVENLEYFSASQIRNIVAEACMYPLRELQKSKFEKITYEEIRKVNMKDFMCVINERKPIVSKEQLEKYKEKV